MSGWGELAIGVVIALGLLSVVFPIFPGLLIVEAAILVWAVLTGGATAWTVFAIATVVLVVGTVIKFTIPGGKMKAAGIPNSTIWLGVLLAVVGLFVIPIVGLFVGFVAGVFLAEWRRVGKAAAWPSTKRALMAVAQSIAIEMAAGFLATAVWLVGVALT